MMGAETSPHIYNTLKAWLKVQSVQKGEEIVLDGYSLDIASVVAVAKHNCNASINRGKDLVANIEGSIKLLDDRLALGHFIYGVNTGFGGSADSRTSDLAGLQSALLQLTQSGVLVSIDHAASTFNYDIGFHCMPVTWVRATMVARCNNAIRGHSGVSLRSAEAILQLLRHGLTPVIPLRGSISASGDLLPLSYIVGVLEGNPDIFVRQNDGTQSRVINTAEALHIAGLEPMTMKPKESLGLINGSATSAAVGSLAAYEASKLSILTQVLTAMSCEALEGNSESFHPFIAAVRPHPGQIEVASNILYFLEGSSLVETALTKDRFKSGLFQDRYAIRSTPQWIGPQLEDMLTAISQLTIELNSTSDNPIIDVKGEEIYSGANFQAVSVTSAMEKHRLALQMIGKLLFSLSSELINSDLNKGLPPNLVADEPSLSFTMKGVDINMAAYMSELAFLANPVSSHVQSAEMHNQPLNSVAFISTRYTMQAIELVSLMCASLLFIVCQALDLRVLHRSYLQRLEADFIPMVDANLLDLQVEERQHLQKTLSKRVRETWNASNSADYDERFVALGDTALLTVLNSFPAKKTVSLKAALETFRAQFVKRSKERFVEIQKEFFVQQNTASFLGGASKRMYQFIRQDLGVPFFHGLVEHPALNPHEKINGRSKKTIGSWISIIYVAVQNDRVHKPTMDCLAARIGETAMRGNNI